MRFLHEAAWCRDADRTAIEQYGLPSVCLMEEACVNIAREISRRFDGLSLLREMATMVPTVLRLLAYCTHMVIKT